jgi:hypothetical protein
MGLDITVYIDPRPATKTEMSALRGGPDATPALDQLEDNGAFASLSGWAAEYISDARRAFMEGGLPGDHYEHELADIIGLHIPYINPDFPQRADDLPFSAYRPGRSWGFRAGSYSGYNRWREELAALAGVTLGDRDEDGARLSRFWAECSEMEERGDTPSVRFWQLIHFSDCEGVIGPSICRKLADDFDAMADAAVASHTATWWLDLYSTWRRAFREAGDTGGWVAFH